MRSDVIYDIEDRLLDIFKSNWNSNVKVIQKDIDFMYYKNNTNFVTKGENRTLIG